MNPAPEPGLRLCPDCGGSYVSAGESTTHPGCPGSGTLASSPPPERTLAASAGHFEAPADTLDLGAAVSPAPVDATPSSGSRKALTREMPEDVKRAMDDPASRMGNYVMLAQIGKGGMGAVWKAWDPKLARYVAVKFLLASSENDVMRFQREAQLAAGLRHPNIAPIYEFGEHLGRHYLVMEYIDGESLEKTRRSAGEVVDTMVPACLAVEYAHQAGVIHRDLKPQNIMLTSKKWVYVMDFGLAKQVEGGSELSASGLVVGTPSYMPPEQAQGLSDRIDRRSDVYSLGATLYFLLTGSAPFKGPTPMDTLLKVVKEDPLAPRRTDPSIPVDLEVITLKAMEKDPDRRYATAAELAEDLQRYSKGESILAKPPSLQYLMLRAVRRNPFLFVSLALALIVVGVLGWTAFGRKESGLSAEEKARQAWAESLKSARRSLQLSTFAGIEGDGSKVIEQFQGAMTRALPIAEDVKKDLALWFQADISSARGRLADWEKLTPNARFEAHQAAKNLAQGATLLVRALERAPEAFRPFASEFSDIGARASAIADFKGVVSLVLNPAPHGRLRSLKGARGHLVKDGALVPDCPMRTSDPDLTTPVVIHDLEIADYEAQFVGPDGSVRTLHIRRGSLTHNRTYLVIGDLSTRDGLRLVPSP